METIEDNVSYFRYPIGNTFPKETLSLYAVSKMVMLDLELKDATNKVRSGVWSKTTKLPYITSSGCFSRRKDNKIISYSGIICIDLDDLDKDCAATAAATAADSCNSSEFVQSVSSLKQILFEDHFLKPAFIFVSPSGNGLKIFIRIRDAVFSHHKDYFKAIALYLSERYNLPADSACSSISNACLLCHDSEALYSIFGCVSHADLLERLPKPPELPTAIVRLNSIYSHFSYRSDYNMHLSDKLNHCSAVHALALICLKQNGWKQRGIFFTRPEKENPNAISATFDIPNNYSIYIFYNFSSNAPPFKAKKGYTDCQVISLLMFDDNYSKCIEFLTDEYDSLIRA